MVSLAILIHPHPQPISLHSVPSHYPIDEANRLQALRRYDVGHFSRWRLRSNCRARARCTFSILQNGPYIIEAAATYARGLIQLACRREQRFRFYGVAPLATTGLSDLIKMTINSQATDK